MDLGAWSVLPPLLAITMAISTRKVFQSLTLGIIAAGVLVAGHETLHAEPGTPWYALFPAALAGGFIQGVRFIIDGVAEPGNATIFIFVLLLGGIIALMQRAGAVRDFGEAAMRVARTKRRGQTLAWLTGATVLAIDDHFNVIAAGTMFRPLTDRLRVSREKLAYIIDSTGAPVAILNPVSTWAGFMVVFAGTSLAAVDYARNGFTTFLASIPYNLYAWLTLAFVLVVAATRLEFGPMARAEARAEAGQVMRPGARPLMSRELDETTPQEHHGSGKPSEQPGRGRPWNLLLPLLFLFIAVLLMLWHTGGFHQPFWAAVPDADPPLSLAVATAATLLWTTLLYRSQGRLRGDDAVDASLAGFKAMLPAMAILALAFGLGGGVAAVGLGEWVVGALQAQVGLSWLPFLAFAVSAGVAFATGTSFGTFAIMIPVAFALVAGHPDGGAWFAPVLAAVSGGGVFGDHCSPISDTTVLSSMAAQCDHIDHVRTQLPYALTTAGMAMAGYALLAVGAPLWTAWSGAALMLLGLVVAARFWRLPGGTRTAEALRDG